jgi:hypothetical protein
LLELKFTLYTILLVGIPIALSFLILWFVRKRKYSSKYRWLALLPVLFLAVGLYQGIMKPYSLYQRHFLEITQFELPETTEFLDYVDWGYGTYPRDNSSLFHIKVEPVFYEKMKSELKPSNARLEIVNESLKHRFETMFGQGFEEKIDFQYSDRNEYGILLHVIGFFEEDKSLLVYAWRD